MNTFENGFQTTKNELTNEKIVKVKSMQTYVFSL